MDLGSNTQAVIPETPEASPEKPEPPRAVTPPKTVPLLLALALLVLLPAVGASIWFGGRLHRVDDRPPPKPRVATRAQGRAAKPAPSIPPGTTDGGLPAPTVPERARPGPGWTAK